MSILYHTISIYKYAYFLLHTLKTLSGEGGGGMYEVFLILLEDSIYQEYTLWETIIKQFIH